MKATPGEEKQGEKDPQMNRFFNIIKGRISATMTKKNTKSFL